ncbi:hypothetical protein LSH36_236g02042 [Paralvinella palmiformis]|uniref:Uncharacterized protein n=1 Tax=Paralvinella palmiformis TaxID=53620 RepID=A0AAD9JMT0_9ANNE|nr:hypothetical protein LSH36_236g02042 [Paralvinella palmiformis]
MFAVLFVNDLKHVFHSVCFHWFAPFFVRFQFVRLICIFKLTTGNDFVCLKLPFLVFLLISQCSFQNDCQ